MATVLRPDGDRPHLDLSRPVSLDAVISSLAILRWELDNVIGRLQSRSAARSVRHLARDVPDAKMAEIRDWEAKMARGDRPPHDPPDLLEKRLRSQR